MAGRKEAVRRSSLAMFAWVLLVFPWAATAGADVDPDDLLIMAQSFTAKQGLQQGGGWQNSSTVPVGNWTGVICYRDGTFALNLSSAGLAGGDWVCEPPGVLQIHAALLVTALCQSGLMFTPACTGKLGEAWPALTSFVNMRQLNLSNNLLSGRHRSAEHVSFDLLPSLMLIRSAGTMPSSWQAFNLTQLDLSFNRLSVSFGPP